MNIIRVFTLHLLVTVSQLSYLCGLPSELKLGHLCCHHLSRVEAVVYCQGSLQLSRMVQLRRVAWQTLIVDHCQLLVVARQQLCYQLVICCWVHVILDSLLRGGQ